MPSTKPTIESRFGDAGLLTTAWIDRAEVVRSRERDRHLAFAGRRARPIDAHRDALLLVDRAARRRRHVTHGSAACAVNVERRLAACCRRRRDRSDADTGRTSAARARARPPNAKPGGGPPPPPASAPTNGTRFCSTTATPISAAARQLDHVDARHRVARRLLPVRVADVRLVHHVAPLAAGERRVVVPRDLGVAARTARARASARSFVDARPCSAYRRFLRDRDVQLVQVRRRLHRVQHELVERVAGTAAAARSPSRSALARAACRTSSTTRSASR